MDALALSSPADWSAAVLAVVLVGLSKGGLGGAGALMGVPLMSLVMSPVQAAGLLLPLLIIMDGVSLWTWWRAWDRDLLREVLPGAIFGVGLGWALAAMVSDDAVRLIVAVICLVFVGQWLRSLESGRTEPRARNPVKGAFWGGVAGYTSFVAHAGSPPFNVYALPLGLTPARFTGTAVAFFTAVNLVKLLPYAALGQLGVGNLATSALLVPPAALAVLAGAFVVRRMRAEVFYPFMYVMVLLVGLKLLWDGATGLLS